MCLLNNIKISVIVPVYNNQDTIHRCLSSILNQTYRNIEIIIIDDGSTDNSFKFCHEISESDDRVKIITQKNGGVSQARLNGLHLSTGEYVSFIDSDDFINEHMFENMISVLKSKSYDIVECGFNQIIDDKIVPFSVNYKTYTNEDVLLNFIQNQNTYVYLWNKLYKATLFKNFSVFKFRYSEDYYWNVVLHMKALTKICINTNDYNYIYNLTGACHNYNNIHKIDGIFVGREVEKILTNHNLNYQGLGIIYSLKYAIQIYIELSIRFKYSKYRSQIRRCYKEDYAKLKKNHYQVCESTYLLFKFWFFRYFSVIYLFLYKILKKIRG